MPIAQIMHIKKRAKVPTMRTSVIPLSIIFKLNDFSSSFNDSQNPIVFMLAATALAKANIIPTDAPSSAPNDLETM